jgi:hypothetical protein
MANALTYAQPMLSPRGVGLGAYGTSAKDSRDFVANPAGIVGMKDWDFSASTYLPVSSGAGDGFVFGSIAGGKRFLENHALAARYTPGALLEFVIPSTIVIKGVGIAADRTITYKEPAAAAYAFQFSNHLSAGVETRYRTETVSDPLYKFVDSTIVSDANESRISTWFFDAGLTWRPLGNVALSAVGRNLAKIKNGSFPGEFKDFALPARRTVELGVGIDLHPKLTLTATVGSDKYGAIGGEWMPGFGLALRGAMYLSSREDNTLYAVGASAGWSIGVLEFDAGYLHFTSQDGRQGSTSTSDIDASSIRNVAMNAFTPDRIMLSAKIILGDVRESLTRIVGVEIAGGVYPSAYQSLAYRPIGKVRVRNLSGNPVEASASFYVDRLMDAPTESPSVTIAPHAEADVPLTAIFNESVRSVSTLTVREGNVYLKTTAVEHVDDQVQTRVLVHGKNDWDGDVLALRYFVTPDDPEVIRYSRDILLARSDSLANVPATLQQFRKAALLFDAFAGKLLYVNDPKQSADYVQYPAETLVIRGGDCDDMTVCFSSLLNSIGIGTAFVDVVPPGHLRSPKVNESLVPSERRDGPENGHIYLMFDTGLAPRFASHIAANPKRYVIRKNKSGAETIWIPVESTVVTKGFASAWAEGAKEYFDDVEVNLGLVKGWVRIVDLY